jgi:shikimate kinase/3-dehydroquinate synthase
MPLFLIGFMAAGKTSVGRAIAAATDRVFVDLDDEIAKLGEAPAALVARDEPQFRRREAGALIDIIRGGTGERDYVLATGGGAAAYGDNLDRMRQSGCVIALGVDVLVAKARATASGGVRPLLARAEQLAAERAPIYRRAHAVVDTTNKTIAEVVDNVRAVERVWESVPMQHRDGTTIVALGERSYPVVVAPSIDAGMIAPAPRPSSLGVVSGASDVSTDRTSADGAGTSGVEAVSPVPTAQRSPSDSTPSIVIITDRNVAASAPCMALPAALGVEPLVIEPGEASKTLATYERLCNELIARGVDRGSTIVALGGGVVGDLAGFVAATLFRGIAVVQVPTTILAMADAAIGGKTAVDTPAGKNLIGAFHQPRLVFCGLDTLTTLPARERRAAFGELWKYALLDGRHLWKCVEACAGWAAGPDGVAPPHELRDVIARAIAYKAAIVGRDERELTGHRALLNLGHTVGHAIESASGMLHGEAVGLGLLAACRVSRALGAPDLEPELRAALAASGLAVDLDRWLTEDVISRIRVDKKRVGKSLRFVAIREVGLCEPVDIAVEQVQRFLRSEFRA